jgi:hypothetical protein
MLISAARIFDIQENTQEISVFRCGDLSALTGDEDGEPGERRYDSELLRQQVHSASTYMITGTPALQRLLPSTPIRFGEGQERNANYVQIFTVS